MTTPTPVLGAVRASPRRNREEHTCHRCPELPLRAQCPHSAEGREYLAQFASQSKNSSRAPSRCSKCPNRPLRSQCEHTSAGRTFLLQQQIQAAVMGTTSPTAPTLLTPSTPVSLLESDTTRRDLFVPSSSPLGAPLAPSLDPDRGTIIQPTVSDFTALNFNPTSESLDPALRDFAVPSSSPPSQSQAGPPPSGHGRELPVTPASTSRTISSVMTPSSQPISTSSTPSKASRKHERSTKGNPFHGFVKGAMRGPQDHAIFRRHKRPDALVDSKEASKTFLDKMNRLVERAEDISVLTGCWLFIGAQHPGGAGSTIHYTSPRLLRDAPDQAGDIVNSYHQLMGNLLQARRLEALNISQKYQASLAENQAMATRVADLESQMMTMQQSIDLYQSRLFSLGQSRPPDSSQTSQSSESPDHFPTAA